MWFIQKMCILCLKRNKDLKSIYTKDDNNVFIVDKLSYAITSLNTNLHDCPMFICERCDKRLNNMYIYKHQCVKSISYITNCILNVNKNSESGVDNKVIYDFGIHSKSNGTQALCINEPENDINSDNINENLRFIKKEGEVNVDYDLFEAQIQNTDLKNEVKDEIDSNVSSETQNILLEIQLKERTIGTTSQIHDNKLETSEQCRVKQVEENVANIQMRERFEVNDNQNIDKDTKNVEAEVQESNFAKICLNNFANSTNCNEKQLLKCLIYESEFEDKLEFTGHMHTEEKEKCYNCNVCKKVFKYYSHLIRHFRIHTGERPFKCSICTKAFNRSNTLNRHMRIHSGEKPFKCDVCLKTFCRQAHLNDHKRIHTQEKPFKCNICKKPFRLSHNLKAHLRIHSEEKPFKCDVCLNTFRYAGGLKIHMRIHTNEKPFKCDTCLKTFRQQTHLNDHMRIHSKEKPVKKCDVCLDVFHHEASLKKHMRNHTLEAI